MKINPYTQKVTLSQTILVISILGLSVFGLLSAFNPQTARAASVWVSNQPACAFGPYSVTVYWDVSPNPTWGYFVDISPDLSFSSFWNKQVTGNSRSTQAPTGFGPSQFGEPAPAGAVQLNPGTTYYARVFNGTHHPNASPGVSFSVPACPTGNSRDPVDATPGWGGTLVFNPTNSTWLVVSNAAGDRGGTSKTNYGRIMDNNGNPVTDVFRIAPDQFEPLAPRAAYAKDLDKYLVVWINAVKYPGGEGVWYGQFLNPDGTFYGNYFEISRPGGAQYSSNSASLQYDGKNRKFVLVWENRLPGINAYLITIEPDKTISPIIKVAADGKEYRSAVLAINERDNEYCVGYTITSDENISSSGNAIAVKPVNALTGQVGSQSIVSLNSGLNAMTYNTQEDDYFILYGKIGEINVYGQSLESCDSATMGGETLIQEQAGVSSLAYNPTSNTYGIVSQNQNDLSNRAIVINTSGNILSDAPVFLNGRIGNFAPVVTANTNNGKFAATSSQDLAITRFVSDIGLGLGAPTPTPTPVPGEPTCSSSGPLNATVAYNASSHDVYAYGVQNASAVYFPTWSSVEGQDDLVWYPGTNLGSGTWSATIDFSRHKPGRADSGQFYTHIYMNGNGYEDVPCGKADFIKESSPAPTPAPSQPSISNLPSCSSGPYNATISWSGTPNPTYGFYVDIDDDPNFGSLYNKNVGFVTSTTTSNFKGIYPSQNQTLSLQPGVTYYTRVFNGQHSQANSFSVPACSTPIPTTFTTDNYRGGNTPVIVRTNIYDYQPSVMFEGGKYRTWWCGGIAGDHIFYSESTALSGPWSNPSIVFANRNNPNDGVLYFDELHVCDPSVIKTGNTYYMYYGGYDEIPGNADGSTNIGVASSPDGISWTRLNNGNPIIMGARLPGSSSYNSLANKYGAGQPSATYVNGYFYITYTDTTGLASNTGNGAGQYVLRSSDPTFQTNVEELVGPTTFAPKNSLNHTTYSWLDAFGIDWQYSDLLNAFVIASHWASNISHILFKDVSMPSGELASRVSIQGEWREGPGLVSSVDGHSLSNPGGVIPLDVVRAVGSSDPNSWDLAYIGVDLHTGITTLTQPVVSNLPSCSTGPYNATISWSGTPNPTYGFYVDIDDDPNFGSLYNKNVGSVTSTNASGFLGIYPSQNQTLSLQPGVTYYTRVFNGEHSVSTPFVVQGCSGPPPPPPPTSGHSIVIRARGTMAGGEYPRMELKVNGAILQTWTISGNFQDYIFNTLGDLNGNIQIYFPNDYYDPPEDRNLIVDYIYFDGRIIQSEDSSVFSYGNYNPGVGCDRGYRGVEILHCQNGYFEYPTAGTLPPPPLD